MTTSAGEIQQLAKRIRLSVAQNKVVETKLATSQRIIARVTDGIYREPWAAFRELVANAYDADATSVVIETGALEFEQITVRDNGNGMSPEALAYILSSIGGSSKRTTAGAKLNTAQEIELDHSPGGRLLIGKIGIGLFAVAQLTQHFQIVTKADGEKVRTSATIRLRTHDEEDLSNTAGDDYVAGSVTIKSEKVPNGEINSHGTSIILYDLRPEIKRTLQDVRRWTASQVEDFDGEAIIQEPVYHIGLLAGAAGKKHPGVKPNLPWLASDSPNDKFTKLIDAAADVSGRGTKQANLEHFDAYLQLIWKLSLSLPLEYVRGHPFDIDGGQGMIFYDVPGGRGQARQMKVRKSKSLREHLDLKSGTEDPCGGFSVELDGIAIKRPIVLPTELRKDSRIPAPVMMVSKEKAPFKDEELARAGGPLEFEAYLYWNSKIVPKDTAGVVVRVREASGTLFDPGFLKYQVSEQTRLRQITAEIFIREGLDSAINIDRESFNYSHPHFLYIQRWLHKALRLFVNRLKALADEDLRKEKVERREAGRKAITNTALSVWKNRLGETADLPVPGHKSDEVAPEVGGVTIKWEHASPRGDPTRASALAIVLEAYGVLSNLSEHDRARLINDIIEIFDPQE